MQSTSMDKFFGPAIPVHPARFIVISEHYEGLNTIRAIIIIIRGASQTPPPIVSENKTNCFHWQHSFVLYLSLLNTN